MSAVEKRRVLLGNHEDQLDGEVITYDEFVSLLRPKWPDATEADLRSAFEHWPLVRHPAVATE